MNKTKVSFKILLTYDSFYLVILSLFIYYYLEPKKFLNVILFMEILFKNYKRCIKNFSSINILYYNDRISYLKFL